MDMLYLSVNQRLISINVFLFLYLLYRITPSHQNFGLVIS